MSAKRALVFSFAYFPRLVGGAEIAVREITDRIDPVEIEFDLIALRSPGEPSFERIGNVDIHRVGMLSPGSSRGKYLYPFLAARKAAELHRERPFDMTWAIMASFSGFAGLFFRLFHTDVPFLLTLQEGDPIEYIQKKSFRVKIAGLSIPVRPLVYRFFKMIFSRADRIQAISNYLADFGRSMGAQGEVVVVPNGVDVERFSRTIAPDESARVAEEIGKEAGDIWLVTTSRLVVKNAVGDIIDALGHLPLNAKLLVIGSGELEPTLRAQAEKLGYLGDEGRPPRVVFKGYVGHDEMLAYLRACDIFVRPSRSEGFGNSFVEAMAARLPVIATPTGGIVDFLRDKETGLFCDVGSPEDIARKAEIYIRDWRLRDEIVGNAYRMVVDRYDWGMVAREMREEAFDPLLVRTGER